MVLFWIILIGFLVMLKHCIAFSSNYEYSPFREERERETCMNDWFMKCCQVWWYIIILLIRAVSSITLHEPDWKEQMTEKDEREWLTRDNVSACGRSFLTEWRLKKTVSHKPNGCTFPIFFRRTFSLRGVLKLFFIMRLHLICTFSRHKPLFKP